MPNKDKTGLLGNQIEQTDYLEFYVYSKNSTLKLIQKSINDFIKESYKFIRVVNVDICFKHFKMDCSFASNDKFKKKRESKDFYKE